MGQHVLNCRIDVDGLHLKGIGTYAEGHIFPIESVPEKLIIKAKAGDTGVNKKKVRVPICTFMTPDGAFITINKAYIPQFGIGKPPVVDNTRPDNKPIQEQNLVKEEKKEEPVKVEVVAEKKSEQVYESSKKPRKSDKVVVSAKKKL